MGSEIESIDYELKCYSAYAKKHDSKSFYKLVKKFDREEDAANFAIEYHQKHPEELVSIIREEYMKIYLKQD